jgi:HAD superfamily phosphoserine phosphatase-like hydrolase
MTETADKNKRIAVFDICDTLYYSNTTHDFVDFCLAARKASIKRLAGMLLTGRFSPLRYFGITVSVLTGKDLPRAAKVFLLKGLSESELRETARDFVREYLEPRKIKQAQRIVSDSVSDGVTAVLCSSSIEPVVRAVAESLNIENFVCTTLEFQNGTFTGRLAADVTGRKLDHLRTAVPNSCIVLAVSDNKTDLELLLAANRGVAMVYGERSREFWKGHGIETIDADQ